jgi:flagellar motor switch protein FliM
MLSQSEIDNLVSNVTEDNTAQDEGSGGTGSEKWSGESVAEKEDDKKVRPYNFYATERFSKEQIRAVMLVHEDMAERFSSTLLPFLRSEMIFKVANLEQGRFEELVQELPEDSLFHMISLQPLPDKLVFIISPELCWVILGRLLGGDGDTTEPPGGMTEIGQSLMSMFVEQMLEDMKTAWSKFTSLEPKLDDTTLNQQWVQMKMANARVLLLTFDITLMQTSGTMSLFIPFTTLKPVANLLNPYIWITGSKEKKTNAVAQDKVLRKLKEVNLPVKVTLGNADLSLEEMMSLQVGDIIRLHSFTDGELEMDVAGRTQFKVRVGRVRNRLAVQISSILTSEEEDRS